MVIALRSADIPIKKMFSTDYRYIFKLELYFFYLLFVFIY